MSSELKVIDPTALSDTERTELDANIDSLIAAHKNNRQEINRLVFDSISAMTVSEDYERQLANKKRLRRFLGSITGSNKKLQDKINSSRAAAQYASQQTLQRLAEQNLMTFDLIATVNNKLNASIVAVESEINQVYSALITFFKRNRSDMIQLENRVTKLERNVNLLNWQASIEYQMFGETEYKELDDIAKVVCLVRDFYDISQGEWTTSDLLLLKAAMSEIGVEPNSKINYFSFIRELYERKELCEKLLNGQSIATIPQPDYLPVLCGVKKLELLETKENYIVKTAAGLLSSHQVDVETRQISNDLTVNYLAQEGSVNINSEVDCYSLILEMLFSLRQAQEEGVFSGGVDNIIDVEMPTNDANAALGEKELSPEQWHELGRRYEESNSLEAFRCYQVAAEQGYSEAQYDLARCYDIGKGTVQDKIQAAEWYAKAAGQGHPWAQYSLGKCYERGDGIVRNKNQAVEWYSKAAEQGHLAAQLELGIYYEQKYNKVSTNNPDKNTYKAKAKEWYQKAAKQGDAEAQYRLGKLILNFENASSISRLNFSLRVPPVDGMYSEAARWYAKAAEQEHDGAQFCLGCCYEIGKGVSKSKSKAKTWYQKAAANGNKEAKKRLESL